MRVDALLRSSPVTAPERARQLEAAGFDGTWTGEMNHDPFIPLVRAAEHTERIELGTNIAVAFARSPMNTAHMAWDLQLLSEGRFTLGLGSQIKAHISRRFSMPWSRPAARMEEYISALHAIWDIWESGGRLDFRGDFYQHTYTTPLFCPAPLECARPKVFLAAVGPLMTRVAGRVADGLLCHSFTTADYLRDVTVPALRAGEAAAGRPAGSAEASLGILTVNTQRAEDFEQQAFATRLRIAFYGSTPAYRGVLEHHGWGDAQTELRDLSLQGRWEEMAGVIDDDMLHTIAAVGTPDEIAAIVAARYGDLIDRFTVLSVSGGTPTEPEIDREAEAELLACLRGSFEPSGH
ncbi:MAG: TIGR03617 family F420-dependent LLM class oxidoreductase [Acidimicrobiia bacterium]|nr:TIGR03617 family F420-dependent LLM class oxidoreductase [Acidimicrobiia bacterium]MYC46129.1 TIGR03617 family F420-dependent LLM class oxidoreductase [Acidimicrobiia bacterium]MYI19353.1 TIGR03617 family F420-dependent LLM class oxidoreductase [Acidimicrobiia bacterium]